MHIKKIGQGIDNVNLGGPNKTIPTAAPILTNLFEYNVHGGHGFSLHSEN